MRVMYYYSMKCVLSASKTKQLFMKLSHSNRATLLGFVVFMMSVSLGVPLIANAASSNVAHFAVYCTAGGGLSTSYAHDNVLTCHQDGKPPLFETKVASLTTDPMGAHFVTIVEADCYPDISQVPTVPATTTDHIDCGSGPSATLTLGSTFPAATVAAVTPPPTPGCSASGCDLVTTYIQPITDLLSGMVGIIVVISLIMGGIEYSTSEGDPQKSSKAKRRITNTLFALIAYFFLYAFLQFLIPNGVFH